MKFVSLAGTVFEGDTPAEVLQQIRNDFYYRGEMGAFLDRFACHLSTHYRISITSRDPDEVLEQLLDQAYLLRIS